MPRRKLIIGGYHSDSGFQNIKRCEKCREDKLCQLDRRLPGRWGGGYVALNLHWLCLDCHNKKSRLETVITMASTIEHTRAWMEYAWPKPSHWGEEDSLAFRRWNFYQEKIGFFDTGSVNKGTEEIIKSMADKFGIGLDAVKTCMKMHLYGFGPVDENDPTFT